MKHKYQKLIKEMSFESINIILYFIYILLLIKKKKHLGSKNKVLEKS